MRYNESSCLRNSNSLNLAVQHLREKFLQERALFLSTLWITLSRDISQLSSELIPPLQRQVNVSKKQAMFKKLNSLWKWKIILASTVNTTAYCICFSSLAMFFHQKLFVLKIKLFVESVRVVLLFLRRERNWVQTAEKFDEYDPETTPWPQSGLIFIMWKEIEPLKFRMSQLKTFCLPEKTAWTIGLVNSRWNLQKYRVRKKCFFAARSRYMTVSKILSFQ